MSLNPNKRLGLRIPEEFQYDGPGPEELHRRMAAYERKVCAEALKKALGGLTYWAAVGLLIYGLFLAARGWW